MIGLVVFWYLLVGLACGVKAARLMGGTSGDISDLIVLGGLMLLVLLFWPIAVLIYGLGKLAQLVTSG